MLMTASVSHSCEVVRSLCALYSVAMCYNSGVICQLRCREP